ncbi:uncharacterized protein SPSK_06397 [Sporothrix schenckii 1099-18]|uniref:Uncharacterized protein n=2 Tax=Sporothrix schenckii TaxID=29908 RepID=U7PTJ5_SPOS1|nr:uncharacterized protein SPSK_06397 [Sporothrix schenckii 1099-18]ERS98074.1 hypothetical protein HMPREF1624_04852 [Sporothrix schenckii ATCC 58251]KJR89855.1 hypothetical protein SPSK_06397 [Sporothrix schenckii 1099-18]
MHLSAILAALAATGPAGLTNTLDKEPLQHLTVPEPLANLGIQRARTASGPFSVPGMVANDTSDDNGMATFQRPALVPCVDCYITGFSFDVRYGDGPNGSAGAIANVDTGIYLHHGVLVNLNRSDTTCDKLGGASIQRMFGAGNERGYIDLTSNGTRRAGYYVAPDETVLLIAEIMSMQAGAARDVYVTTTWDYVQAPSSSNTTKTGGAAAAERWAPAVPVWLDIDGDCGTYLNGSEVAVPPGDAVFSYSSPQPWHPQSGAGGAAKNYSVLVSASHLHDGALQLDIAKNGATVCEGVATYGGTPEYVSQVPGPDMPGMPGMSMGPVPLTHISAIHKCYDVGTTSSSDAWSITAHYNFTAHPGLETTNGLAKPIMGIALLFLAEE